MSDVAAIEQFLERFGDYRQQEADAQFGRLCGFVDRLKARLPEFQAEARKQETLTAPRFNVFRVLRLSRNEVLVHTPILAELLNPTGTHGQGFLFLSTFLGAGAKRGLVLPSKPVEQARWRIESEKPAGRYGNLDLVLQCPALRYLMVVENKIGAGEQVDQLSRYRQWMDSQHDVYDVRQLVFLTPTGWESQTVEAGTYVRLAYQENIRPWLLDVSNAVEATPVREILRQYLEILEAL